jgi:hypothetical protein
MIPLQAKQGKEQNRLRMHQQDVTPLASLIGISYHDWDMRRAESRRISSLRMQLHEDPTHEGSACIGRI